MRFRQKAAAFLLSVFAFGSAAAMPVSAFAAESEKPTLYGDVNLDGQVTIDDVTELQRYLAGLAELDKVQLANADVSLDDEVDIADATLIQMQVAGVKTLPETPTEAPTAEEATADEPTTEPAPDVYVLAGSSILLTTGWEPTPADYVMTDNGDGTYSYTLTKVPYIDSLTYEFKVVQFVGGDADNAVWHGNGVQGLSLKVQMENTGSLTITYDLNNETMRAEGQSVRAPQPEIYQVNLVGDGKNNFLYNNTWNIYTCGIVSDGEGRFSEITFRHVTPNEPYTFRFVGNQDWNTSFGAKGEVKLNEDNNAVYDGGNITFTPVSDAEYVNITVSFDLTNYDYATKTGATFRIDVKDPVTYTIQFIDPQNRGLCGLRWEGADGSGESELGAPVINELGEAVYTVTIPDGTTYAYFYCPDTGERTNGISEFNVFGYYVSNETDWNNEYKLFEITDYYLTPDGSGVSDENLMTKTADGVYTLTLENVQPSDSNYRYRVTGRTLTGDTVYGDCIFSVQSACDVTVTFDPVTKKITVEGEYVYKPDNGVNYVTVAGSTTNGNPFVNGLSWEPDAEVNRTTEIDEDIYQITYTAVPAHNGNSYSFKFTANGSWDINWGNGMQHTFYQEETFDYGSVTQNYGGNMTITFPYNGEVTFADITITLNLSEWTAFGDEAYVTVKVEKSASVETTSQLSCPMYSDEALTMTQAEVGTYTYVLTNVQPADNYSVTATRSTGDLVLGASSTEFSVKTACDVTVTYDPENNTVTAAGDGLYTPTPNFTSVNAVGDGRNGFLNDYQWRYRTNANRMSLDSDSKVYRITYYGIDTALVNGAEFVIALNANQNMILYATDSFEFNEIPAEGAALTMDAAYSESDSSRAAIRFGENAPQYVDLTLIVDLTQLDWGTHTGAAITVEATPVVEKYYARLGSFSSELTLGEDGIYRAVVQDFEPDSDVIYPYVLKEYGNDVSDYPGSPFVVSQTCDVTVAFNPETQKITVTGDYVSDPVPSFRINIQGAVNSPSNLKMTENEDGTFSYTIPLSVSNANYKATVSKYFGDNDYQGSVAVQSFAVNTSCDVTLTYNPENNVLEVTGDGVTDASENPTWYTVYHDSGSSKEMFQNADGVWTATFTNVAASDASHRYSVNRYTDYWQSTTEGTVKITVNEPCDVTIFYDPETGETTFEGEHATESVFNYFTVAGSGSGNFLNNVSWDISAAENRMTKTEEGIYQITFNNVDTDCQYQFFVTADGTWEDSWSSDNVQSITQNGTYEFENVRYQGNNPCSLYLNSDLGDLVDVTITLDATGLIPETSDGMKISVTVTNPQN